MADLHQKQIQFLEEKANDIRISIIETLTKAGSGHSGGPLGMADIFTYLYFHELKHDPKNTQWKDRDRMVLSNGHINPVLYATLAHAGYFPLEELKTLRTFGARLQGHPHREFYDGVETSSGPLGSGLSQAVGMALAERMDTPKSHKWFYCLMSDGELDCGQSWEAAMLAGKERIHNLLAIIDRNNIQIDGDTETIMPLEPLAEKWKAWNWHVQEIGGHDFQEIHQAVERAKAVYDRPSVIIARTIPGKGVSFMERRYEWHGIPPDIQDVAGAPAKGKQAETALHELRANGEALRNNHSR